MVRETQSIALKLTKMIHKQFQYPTNDGGIDVQFNIDYDGNAVSVDAIQLHSSVKIDLPRHPRLEYDNESNEWKLCAYYTRIENKKEISVRQWCETEICKDIAKEILRIKEEETPFFGK